MTRAAWPKTHLGLHIDLLTGFPFKSANYTESATDVRLLRGDNVAQGRLRWDGVKRWPASDVAQHEAFQMSEGDVVLAMDRPWIEAGLKWAALTKEDLPCLLVQRVARMRGCNGLRTDFLRYVVADESFVSYIKSIVTGANVPHVSGPDIKKYEFRMPPEDIQARIASVLSAYDDLIDNNTRRIKILEELARSLYREWFVHFRFPGHDKVKLVESPLGMVPEGWRLAPVGDVVSDHIGGGWGEEQPDGKHPEPAYVIRGTDVPDVRQLKRESVPFRYHATSNLASRRLVVNDLVMEVSGGGKFVGVGRTCLVSQRLLEGFAAPVMCASFCKRMVPNPTKLDPVLLWFHIDRRFEAGDLRQYEVQSTGIRNLKFGVFLEREHVVVPSVECQEHFGIAVHPLLDQVEVLAEKNGFLRKTRDLLLPRLLSGDLDVSALPDPAP